MARFSGEEFAKREIGEDESQKGERWSKRFNKADDVAHVNYTGRSLFGDTWKNIDMKDKNFQVMGHAANYTRAITNLQTLIEANDVATQGDYASSTLDEAKQVGFDSISPIFT